MRYEYFEAMSKSEHYRSIALRIQAESLTLKQDGFAEECRGYAESARANADAYADMAKKQREMDGNV